MFCHEGKVCRNIILSWIFYNFAMKSYKCMTSLDYSEE